MSANMPAVKPSRQFSAVIRSQDYQDMINRTLNDPARAARFVAAVSAAVAINPALQECTPGSILTGALLGETLGLVPSPQLGQYYLVPFKDKKKGETHATFVLGYKGYIQLAIRSGYYRNINVLEVKEGEFIGYNPFTEEFNASWISGPEARAKAQTVGYVAMFEYLNGFRKVLYWTKDQMLMHADRYSPAFSAAAYKRILAGDIPDSEMWKYSSYWYKDFDGMGKKTMLRQLISHWGIMSTEMQTAFEKDDTIEEVGAGGEPVPVPTDDAEFPDVIDAPDDIEEAVSLSDV